MDEAARRFVATWPPRVQAAVAEWARAVGAAHVGPVTERMLEVDRAMDERSQAALGDFRALFERDAVREISVGASDALDADRLARMNARAKSLGFESAADMVAQNTNTPRGADALAELRKEDPTCTLRDVERTIEMGADRRRALYERARGMGLGENLAAAASELDIDPADACATIARFGALPDCPRPERYDELVAKGTWPLTVSKADADAYWKRRDASRAFVTPSRHRGNPAVEKIARSIDLAKLGLAAVTDVGVTVTLDAPEVHRASADAVCGTCLKTYAQHPRDQARIDDVRILCDGTRVQT